MAKYKTPLDATHSIWQFSEGFSFGTDAVLLSAMIRPRKNWVGAELGTGTGIIPLLLSIHKEFSQIYALEIQEEYAALAKENIEENGFSHKVKVLCGDLKEVKKHIPFYCDFVFSNPPYMRKESGKVNDNEKKRLARHEIACDIRDVCKSASDLLQDKGEFYCVYRLERMAELFSAMRARLLEPKEIVFVTPKSTSAPELILIKGVKGAKPGLKSRAPLILQNDAGEKTPETARLYETGVLEWEGKA